MIALQRSPTFLAYTYESDEDDDDNEGCFSQLCGCCSDAVDDESKKGSPLYANETSSLMPSTAIRKDIRRNRHYSIRRISEGRLVLGIVLTVSVLVFCEYCFFIRRSGRDPTSISDVAYVETMLFPGVDSNRRNTTVQYSTVGYGEVWLIRHGEKPLLSPGASKEERLLAMYDLSPEGWDRANHLSALMKRGEWPLFSALFASRPATLKEAQDAYPDFVRDATGQSMVRREYQTLVPISEYIQTIHRGNNTHNIDVNETLIHSQFTKGEVKAAALEIAKAAVESSSIYKKLTNNDATGEFLGSPIILVSWDHCSLPTLVVRGFGCSGMSNSQNNEHKTQIDPRCYRCWSDDRFGDVLKLNVSLTTTTTTVTTTINKDIEKITLHDFAVTSTILAMTGEAYSVDRYYIKNSDSTNSSNVNPITGNTTMSIEKSTPCVESYCTSRPASKHLVRCSCWNDR